MDGVALADGTAGDLRGAHDHPSQVSTSWDEVVAQTMLEPVAQTMLSAADVPQTMF